MLPGGTRRKVAGLWDRSSGQKIKLDLWRRAFQPIGIDPEVRECWADFEFWQRMVKERQENLILSNLSGVKTAKRM
jgi:hypothetical protein